ncbi:diguanylate cyclase/phosphodiesterase (GGDEF & EAL domains) with PAS/PAC sensor(s) [plant metagenome]|uniref:Diguanylate cyclase/phosphodiesterase (GGDEF & EAL domains) with PAS/PAC sensor(S) n=1 Tax=plant metagenome TaxID=1297885 RepID=A0A484VF05_9ZZZZ
MPGPLVKEKERIGVLRSMGLLDSAESEDFDRLTRLAAYCFNVPIALISLVDADRQQFLSKVGFIPKETTRDVSLCAHAIHVKDILEVPDLSKDERFQENPLVSGQSHMRFYAGVPLVTDSGYAIGALCLIDTKPRRLDARMREQLKALAKLVMDQIALRQMVGRRDAVSGLPNRHQFVEDQGTMLLLDGSVSRSLILLDLLELAHAHEIAQAVGIGVIESLLRQQAQRLRKALGAEVDIYQVGVTRLAFTVDAAQAVDVLIRDVLAVLAEPVIAEGVPVQLDACVAVVPYVQGERTPLDNLRCAMVTLGAAKASERRWALYDAAQDAQLKRKYRLALDIQRAIAASQLHLVFQPRIDAATGRPTAFEALLRWTHPELGEIGPAEFIPIVERTAVMQSLTRWVLHEALSALPRLDALFPGCRLAVNLSPRDFDDGKLVGSVLELCRTLDVPPGRLELEVTEGEWLHAETGVLKQMQALCEAGAVIAIDDFGTGYSNFSYLTEIPASVVKMDQSLVRRADTDARHRTLLRSVLGVARDLGYRTVAEGVETQEMFDLMREWGVDEIQGFHVSRPVPLEALPAFLANWRGGKGAAMPET